jgi:hypothetical protein
MSKQENMFNKLRRSQQQSESQPEDPSSQNQDEIPVQSSSAETPPLPKKRGRPATGKRSHKDWIGRTYYIQRETDLDVEGELYQLKREGIEMDKSELVNALLAAWVKWRNGENLNFQLDEIPPRRKSEK